MTGLDTNILFHLLIGDSPEHPLVVQWIRGRKGRWCTTATNIAELLRLLTHSRVLPYPMRFKDAVAAVNELVLRLQVEVLQEGEWWKELDGIFAEVRSLRGDEIFDVRIALCFKFHGVREIFTTDSDFRKYSFLKVVFPD